MATTRYVKSSLISKLSVKKIFRWIFFTKLYLSGTRYIYACIARSNKKFKFKDQAFAYFIGRYNYTYYNERCVEIPVINYYRDLFKDKNILEVGNVMSHYIAPTHMIIDKFEKAKGVINADAADFKSETKFDLIFSISTMEHVGWDDDVKDPMKVMEAISNLKSLLAEKGTLVVTAPLGYNPPFDDHILNNRLGFSEQLFLKRINSEGDWIEIDQTQISGAKYNSPFPSANVVLVGIYQN